MFTTSLILLLAMALPTVVVIAGLMAWRARRRSDKRRSPLKDKILNLPGEQLRKQIAKHEDAYSEATALVISLGPIFLSVWLLSRMTGMDWSRIQFGWNDLLMAAAALCVLGWCLWRLVSHATQARRYREGLDAELAVAQSLTPLVAEGGLVFHDFPCDRFNIDHIVVGRSVVFAIETKSRRKPAEKGRESARVIYDGTKLTFPTSHETKPVGQARYQAEWLTKFLASGAGEAVRVVPVVALPGWYVESTQRGRPDVLVTNCNNPLFLLMMDKKYGPPMSESLRKRVAHALFERYPALDEFLGNRA